MLRGHRPDLLLPVEAASDSSRLPIGATGNMTDMLLLCGHNRHGWCLPKLLPKPLGFFLFLLLLLWLFSAACARRPRLPSQSKRSLLVTKNMQNVWMWNFQIKILHTGRGKDCATVTQENKVMIKAWQDASKREEMTLQRWESCPQHSFQEKKVSGKTHPKRMSFTWYNSWNWADFNFPD